MSQVAFRCEDKTDVKVYGPLNLNRHLEEGKWPRLPYLLQGWKCYQFLPALLCVTVEHIETLQCTLISREFTYKYNKQRILNSHHVIQSLYS